MKTGILKKAVLVLDFLLICGLILMGFSEGFNGQYLAMVSPFGIVLGLNIIALQK